jgi:RHS repeat-associated protein
MINEAFVDGLGRTFKTTSNQRYQGGDVVITTETQYDDLGRPFRVSNPSREAPSTWVETKYDVLDRTISVTTPEGSKSQFSYTDSDTVTRDESGKWTKRTVDGLGRVVKVIEDPTVSAPPFADPSHVNPSGLNYETTYRYDARGNLLRVEQGGRNREFVYDAHSQLLRVTSPEIGAQLSQYGDITYHYDQAGNVTSVVDPRASKSFTYDIRGRVVRKTFNGPVPTPESIYCYDGNIQGQCAGAPSSLTGNLLGRLTRVKNSEAQMDFEEYDALGRVKRSRMVITGQAGDAGTFEYGYNDVGLTMEKYPSGRQILYEFDTAGQLRSVSGQKGSEQKTYLSAMEYASHGALEAATFGDGPGRKQRICYNARLQVTGMIWDPTPSMDCGSGAGTLLRISNAYGPPGTNNGNVTAQTIAVGNSWQASQDFTYDALNRLASATEGTTPNGWRQAFAYDRWGNRWIENANSHGVDTTGLPVDASWFTNKNRLKEVDFDDSGNLKQLGGFTLAYDGENRVVSAEKPNFPQDRRSYGYDPEGRRVWEKRGEGATMLTTFFQYDAMGNLAAEYSVAGSGGSLPVPECTTCFLAQDHLGSTRMIWDGSGVRARFDYHPFGEGIAGNRNQRGSLQCGSGACYGGTGALTVKFTGKERDAETGLDYFGARYMSAAQGRFTSPDAPMLAQHPSEPQSWNLYTYTANNPLSRIDPDGRNWFEINGQWQWHEGSDVNDKGEGCKKGTKGCHHSDYTHLLVFQKTGMNREGAATGTLTLYGNDRGQAIMSSPVFSGGHGADPAGDGKYRVNLGRLETLTARDILTGIGENGLRYGYLGAHYGVQELPESLMGATSPWGSIRARLNEWVAGALGVPENMKGLFLHGSRDRLDYTNGCLCERSENILRWVRDTAKNKTPGVFPTIPVLVRR